MVHGRGGTASMRANYLLIAGTGAMVVASVGLFVRASPTLSACFLVVGAALLVISVFAPETKPEVTATTVDLNLAPLDDDSSNATAAETHRY
jgi:hypothetical protein